MPPSASVQAPAAITTCSACNDLAVGQLRTPVTRARSDHQLGRPRPRSSDSAPALTQRRGQRLGQRRGSIAWSSGTSSASRERGRAPAPGARASLARSGAPAGPDAARSSTRARAPPPRRGRARPASVPQRRYPGSMPEALDAARRRTAGYACALASPSSAAAARSARASADWRDHPGRDPRSRRRQARRARARSRAGHAAPPATRPTARSTPPPTTATSNDVVRLCKLGSLRRH